MCRRSKKSVVVNVKVIWSWEKGNFFLLWCDVALIWCYLIPALRRVDGRMTENSRSWNTVQTPSEFTVNLANGSEKGRERDVEAARKRAGSGRRVVGSTVKYCLWILHPPSYAQLIPFCPDRLSVYHRALPWRTQGPEVKRGRVHFTLTRCYAVMEDFIGLPLGKGRPDLI